MDADTSTVLLLLLLPARRLFTLEYSSSLLFHPSGLMWFTTRQPQFLDYNSNHNKPETVAMIEYTKPFWINFDVGFLSLSYTVDLDMTFSYGRVSESASRPKRRAPAPIGGGETGYI